MIRLTVSYIDTRDIPLTDLTPFPGNAKRGNVAEIQASLARTGQYRSLIVRQHADRLTILAGNHTAQALIANGDTTGRCEVVECTDIEARRINLADNRLSELGTYDNDALAELLQGMAEDDGLDGTGYTQADLDMLAGAAPDLDSLADEYGEPAEDDLWPVLKIKVSPTVRDDFYDLTADAGSDDDAARFVFLINRVRGLAP